MLSAVDAILVARWKLRPDLYPPAPSPSPQVATAGVGSCDVSTVRGVGKVLSGVLYPVSSPKPPTEALQLLSQPFTLRFGSDDGGRGGVAGSDLAVAEVAATPPEILAARLRLQMPAEGGAAGAAPPSAAAAVVKHAQPRVHASGGADASGRSSLARGADGAPPLAPPQRSQAAAADGSGGMRLPSPEELLHMRLRARSREAAADGEARVGDARGSERPLKEDEDGDDTPAARDVSDLLSGGRKRTGGRKGKSKF